MRCLCPPDNPTPRSPIWVWLLDVAAIDGDLALLRPEKPEQQFGQSAFAAIRLASEQALVFHALLSSSAGVQTRLSGPRHLCFCSPWTGQPVCSLEV